MRNRRKTSSNRSALSKIIASLKLFGFALACLVVVPTQSLVLAVTRGPAAYVLPRLWHRCVCAIFAIRYEVEGTPVTDHQTIFMSNHISYLDIPVIASVLKASFVAKEDVARWPVFGFLSNLQQTAFISRSRKDAGDVKGGLENMLQEGKSLIIFPEGTSTDGRDVRPFKSSLFALAMERENKDLMVQPMTLSMESADGRAIETQDDRDLYSWHIDMDTELPDHLWRFAQSKGAVIKIKFHTPLRASTFHDRKLLANQCYDDVRGGLLGTSLKHAA